ncbi:rod-binding protein [Albimonas sp. CAU 1670]|uniref:rod-binding protein n=1 Tax=Albimonas sp. CAU 1670 TaxID=3032599 RepID=UPI0023DB542D|nr:rod-binding protein [Albimonas sp. CAU 1670]MDF2235601.1 rod-binding protein [Albimonas sp. CAU 1670]
MRAAAVEFESMFLAEMLTAAGLGRPPEGFGGGVGEQAFAGLLVREQARLWAERGGIGLAESIYRSLVRDAAAT